MDNVLCDGVGRSGFRTEDAYQWNGRLMTGFDLMILMDEVQQIQLLTFVFMQTLGLDIKHSIGVDFHILSFQKPVGQIFFVSFFYGGQFIQNCFVVRKGQQFFQFGRILAETGADVLFQSGSQSRITFQQPAAECNTVGLVVEFLRVQFIKAVQF